MTTTKALTGPLLDSGSRAIPRSAEYVSRIFEKFGVDKYCFYIDHTTVAKDLPEISGFEIAGYYTFDLRLVGNVINGTKVNLIKTTNTPNSVDGWLAASTSRAAAFSLAHALKETGNEHQIIVRLYGGQTTEISAYMDVFSGETETVIYLNHYYDRKYRVIFPIEVRYSFCECDGTVLKSGQRILRPGEITVFKTSEMELGEFQGYFRVELEVENLQVRVQPFIHFWADYISPAGMCRNHQSGWSPWPSHTVFNRGYLPVNGEHEAIVSIYNENDDAIEVNALLHFTRNDIEEIFERTLKAVLPGEMSYQNISDLFADIETDDVNAAYVLLTCDHPLHRPNYYITKKGTKELVDTFHQTGGKACHWAIPSYGHSKRELDRMKSFGVSHPWGIDLPILPSSFEMETFIGLLSLTLCDSRGFGVDFFNEKGTLISSFNFPIDGSVPIFTNVNTWAKEHGVELPNGGMVRFRNSETGEGASQRTAIFFGLKHKKFPNLSTSFAGSANNRNIPFYLNGSFPKSREYEFSPLVVSDPFSPGVCSDEYDSLHLVQHSSLIDGYNKPCEYRLDIIDESGRQYSIHRIIPPQSFDVFWLSDILNKAGIETGGDNYTIWVKSYDTKLKLFHLLYRKHDHAMSMDDGSEGTLQKEPQIAGIKGDSSSLELFLQTINKTEAAKIIPDNIKSAIKRALLRQ